MLTHTLLVNQVTINGKLSESFEMSTIVRKNREVKDQGKTVLAWTLTTLAVQYSIVNGNCSEYYHHFL